MKTRHFPPAAVLLLTAVALGGCIIEDREVDVVVTGDIPATWHTEGDNSSGVDIANVNAAPDVEDALDNLDADSDIKSINIAGGSYEVLANSGFVGAHSGTVYVSATGVSEMAAMTFDAPSNEVGASGSHGVELNLQGTGIEFLNTRLNDYLDSGPPRDQSLLQFTFRTVWTSTPPGTSEYNFDWKTALVLQIVGTIKVKVPNP